VFHIAIKRYYNFKQQVINIGKQLLPSVPRIVALITVNTNTVGRVGRKAISIISSLKWGPIPLEIKQYFSFSTDVNYISILLAYFLTIFWCQNIAKPNVIRDNLLNLLLYEKCSCKMLIKLTPAFIVIFFWYLHHYCTFAYICETDI